MDEFEQSDLEKETNDSHNTCYQNAMGYSRKYPPPPYGRHWVPRNFSISKRISSSLWRIPNPADSKSLGILEFCKVLNGFAGIPIKIHKIAGKFVEFQSVLPSIYYRISNVIHGNVWIFSGIAQYFIKKKKMVS